MDLFEAIENAPGVRSYDPVNIPDEHIKKIIDAGRRAPSGKNLQPLAFIAIRAKDTLEKLSRVQGCVGQASAAIAIVANPDASPYWLEDAAAAAENMLLAIKALGYDSVWIQGALRRHEDYARELLGVPKNRKLIILLPIGEADAETPQQPKRPLEETLHWEKW